MTGGAAGIGEAIVRALAAAGAATLFCDVAAARLGQKKLAWEGQRVRFLAADASEERAVERLVAEAPGWSGKLDIAVNNVGGYGAGDNGELAVHDTPVGVWQAARSLTSRRSRHCVARRCPHPPMSQRKRLCTL